MLVALLSLIKLSVLTRYLDPDDFGLMAVVTFILGIMSLFVDLGLGAAILHKQRISRNEYSSLFWVSVLFSLFVIIIICVLSPVVAKFYDEPRLSRLIPVMSLTVFFSALGGQFKVVFQKNLNFRLLSIVEVISAFIGFVIAIFLAFLNYGVFSLVFGALVQYAISNLIFLMFGLRTNPINFHLRFIEVKPFLLIGLYQVGGQVVNHINRDMDILLVGKFLGLEALGGYSLAKQLVQRPMQILNPILSRVASPILASIQHTQDRLNEKFLELVNLVSTLNFGAYGILILLTKPIVYALYGENFIEITNVVQILSCYMFFRAIGNPVGSLLIATGRTDLDLFWNLFGLLLSPVIVFFCVQYSIEFLAWGLVISSLFMLYPFWRYVINRASGIERNDFFRALYPNVRKVYRLFKGLAITVVR